MADMTAAYAALEKAHAAGDKASAQKLADYIRANNSGNAPTEGVTALPMHPVEFAADTVKDVRNWFSANEPKEVSAGEAAGAVAGGAAAGAAGGAVLPGLLKAGGKVIPGAIGKGVQGLGELMSALPLKERVIRGAGGGAAMGAVEKAGEAMGAPDAVTFGAGMLAGGAGESAASFLTKESGQLLRFVGNLSYGNVAGASRALQGMLQPNKALNEATAVKLQKKLFGERTEGYVNGLVGSNNRRAAQEALRKADPSLVPGPRAAGGVRAPWDSSTGEMKPMSGVTDVAVAGSQRPVLGFDPMAATTAAAKGIAGPAADPTAVSLARGAGQPAGTAAAAAKPLPPGFAAGKAAAAGKAKAAADAAAKLETAAAEQALKPASQIYRERMFQGVTQGVQAGKTFSATPEFGEFQKQLGTLVTLGEVSNAEAQGLLRTLRADRSPSKAVLERYAETVDNRIREWGKPAEGAAATGASAVNSKVAGEVRAGLQKAYNQYTTRLGLGSVEQQYRNAYSQEMVAEAKDKLPHFLYGFESGKEFAKMARNLAKDPQGLPFIQQAVAKHMANAEPKALPAEFERLQQVLVNAKLVQPADLRGLREGAATVRRIADSGQKLKAAGALKQMLMLAMTRQAGVSGGAAAGSDAGADVEQQ